MSTTIAPVSVLRLRPAEGTAARALRQVTPPAAAERERTLPASQTEASHTASAVALAPAAMLALIEAQEHMGGGSEFDRVRTVQKIDRLISRLGEGDPPPPPSSSGAPLTLRRLQTARELLV